MNEIVGRYRLGPRIGGGGMAEVFVGSTLGVEGFERSVAIKRVLPGFSQDPQFAQMFAAEAQLSSRLVHPNVVSVVDFDRDADGRLFIVMELVEGRDLDALAATGPLPFSIIVCVIVEVLRALAYAHVLPIGDAGRGIVHRDVSPHNVLLSWHGAVKLADFGIAKVRDASEATASVLLKGKPAYMSPEQANGQPLDGRSDLFSVGVMLWELLVGRRLFLAEDTRGTLAAVLFGAVPSPRHLRGDVPKDLERIVMRLLERDRAARYPTAEAAGADLLACSTGVARPDVLATLIAERFAPRSPPAHTSTPSGGVGPHSRRGLAVVVILAIVVVVAGAAIVSGRSSHSNEVAQTARDKPEPAPQTTPSSVLAMTAPTDAPVPRDAAPVEAPADARTFRPDLKLIGPHCVASYRFLERLARCKAISQAARDSWELTFQNQLDAIEDYVGQIHRGTSMFKDARALEPGCRTALEAYVKLAAFETKCHFTHGDEVECVPEC